MQSIAGNSFQADIAGAVRGELARQGLSYIALAGILHVSRATAYRRSNGESAFAADELEAIAAHLGITVDDIFVSAEFGASISQRRAAA